jgi:hypothetical protein
MTGLPIISADERLKETRGVKGVLLGTSGIGKTSQLWTLPPESTLFMDLEAGDLAIEGWLGDTIRPRTWAECRDFAVFIGGANPALRDEQARPDEILRILRAAIERAEGRRSRASRASLVGRASRVNPGRVRATAPRKQW